MSSSAKASGADPSANGTAKHREHHDGSKGRAFTVEQKAAVVRVRKCSPTAFYDILGLEAERTTVDDGGIKKAYRKLSLLTHPDKNGYEGADEAFKMVSRAFQILSDPDKKKRFDQFGGDPDNRFSSSGASASPFSGFARSPGGARGPMFEEEMTPEELFRQFFGGGMGGGGFGGPFGGGGGFFDASPGFVFNLGGGPGIRVHQFGGGRPRRRQPGMRPDTTNGTAQQETPSAMAALTNLLPLLILFLFPILTSLFSSSTDTTSARGPSVPAFHLDTPMPPLTHLRTSAQLHVPYYVNPADVAEYPPNGKGRKWSALDHAAERHLVTRLSRECDREARERDRLVEEARGWFFPDQEKMEMARRLEMASCRRLRELGLR